MKKRLIIFVLAVLAISAFLSGLVYLKYCEIKPEIAFLIITAVTVFWYTFETHEMRREIVSQNQIQIMPILIFERIKDTKEFMLTNLGNFPAFNIMISDFTFKGNMKVVFESASMILPKQNLPIRWRIFVDNREHDDMGYAFIYDLLPELDKHDFSTRVTFQNIHGKKYEVDLGFGINGLKVGKPK